MGTLASDKLNWPGKILAFVKEITFLSHLTH